MKMTGGVLAVAALIAMGSTDAAAQRAGPGRAEMGMRQRAGVEMLMRMRDRLELTEDQIAKLDAMRQEGVERRKAQMESMLEMRSRIAAGETDQAEAREAMRAMRESHAAMRDAQKEKVDAILTDAQRESLAQMRGRARAFMAGRAMGMRQGGRQAFRGRGGHGMRGQGMRGRGMRGQGMRGRGMRGQGMMRRRGGGS
jgi:Spy/CpxP family protein refolding chaperone